MTHRNRSTQPIISKHGGRVLKRVRAVLYRAGYSTPIIEDYCDGVLDSNTEAETQRMSEEELLEDFRVFQQVVDTDAASKASAMAYLHGRNHEDPRTQPARGQLAAATLTAAMILGE